MLATDTLIVLVDGLVNGVNKIERKIKKLKYKNIVERELRRSPYREDGVLPPTRGRRMRYCYRKKVDSDR